MHLRITVAICTWNRCERLKTTLSTLAATSVPPGVEWDVVVVNNNSSDATEAIVGSFATALPIRHVFEPRPGVSYARNTAARNAAGDYVFWLDDDVLVPTNWMAAYVDAIARHPEAAVLGGPITPHFEVDPPAWIATNLSRIPEPFGVLDIGSHERPIEFSTNHFPFGANCVVRRAELTKFSYDTSIGRSPTEAFLGGEETGLMKAILASGCSGWWVPGATLAHRIRPDQLNLKYVDRYYVGVGRWMGLADRQAKFKTVFGYPRWMLLELSHLELRYWLLRPFRSPFAVLQLLKARRILLGRLLSFPATRNTR